MGCLEYGWDKTVSCIHACQCPCAQLCVLLSQDLVMSSRSSQIPRASHVSLNTLQCGWHPLRRGMLEQCTTWRTVHGGPAFRGLSPGLNDLCAGGREGWCLARFSPPSSSESSIASWLITQTLESGSFQINIPVVLFAGKVIWVRLLIFFKLHFPNL